MIVKTNVFESDGDRFLHFEHVAIIFCGTPYFRFGKIVIFSKDSIDSEYVFFLSKTLSRSIYTSFMIKGGGQGVLKRKNY